MCAHRQDSLDTGLPEAARPQKEDSYSEDSPGVRAEVEGRGGGHLEGGKRREWGVPGLHRVGQGSSVAYDYSTSPLGVPATSPSCSQSPLAPFYSRVLSRPGDFPGGAPP